MGFSYVETDIQCTSDGIWVLSHDLDINRCARYTNGEVISDVGKVIGSYTFVLGDVGVPKSVTPVLADVGKHIGGYAIQSADVGNTISVTPVNSVTVASLTYAQIRTYDFGIWKSATYAGTLIPSFEEFILLCKKLTLHPYIELKISLNDTNKATLAAILKRHNMANSVTIITPSSANVTAVLSVIPNARIGYMIGVDANAITNVNAVKTATSNIFINTDYGTINDTYLEGVLQAGIIVEAYVIDSQAVVDTCVNRGIRGIATNSLNIASILGN